VFHVDERGRSAAAAALRREGLAPDAVFAVLAPAANRLPAQWGPERFAAVADGLHEAGIGALFVGRKEDEAIVARALAAARFPHASLCGETTLAELAALLERASLLVGNDSGPAHLAAAVDCPTVAVFGPTDPALTFPYEDGERFVSVRAPAGHALPCFDAACRADHGFSRVAPETVLAAGLRALAAGRACRRRA
jgi:ADP-heptose:LPS heptosyltransferase